MEEIWLHEAAPFMRVCPTVQAFMGMLLGVGGVPSDPLVFLVPDPFIPSTLCLTSHTHGVFRFISQLGPGLGEACL